MGSGGMKGMGGVGAGEEGRHVVRGELRRRREKKLCHYAAFSFSLILFRRTLKLLWVLEALESCSDAGERRG